MEYVSVLEYLMNRITMDKLSDEQVRNLNTIVPRANTLLYAFGEARRVTSGYRSTSDQARINPSAPASKHLVCAAVDLEDVDGKLKTWCMANLDTLESIGLWMEDPKSTLTWVHVQCIAPRSGHRVFIP